MGAAIIVAMEEDERSTQQNQRKLTMFLMITVLFSLLALACFHAPSLSERRNLAPGNNNNKSPSPQRKASKNKGAAIWDRMRKVQERMRKAEENLNIAPTKPAPRKAT